MVLPQEIHSFIRTRGQVARLLLEHSSNGKRDMRLSLRDIAAMLGTDWLSVYRALRSMQAEGAIRLERHRLLINRELLGKLASNTV